MGNVTASPPVTLIPLAEERPLENPGTFEEIHRKTKGILFGALQPDTQIGLHESYVVSSDVFPLTFNGAKISVNNGLGNCFRSSHTLLLTPLGYKFGVTYVGAQQNYGLDEAFAILFGDIDPSGNLNANIIHQFNRNTRVKFFSQVTCCYLMVLHFIFKLSS